MMGDNAQVGIIGGTGRMGSWLARVLERRGHRVLKAGRRTRVAPEHAARSCDVVVVSVPLDRTIRVIEQVAPLVREDALLMDLTSVKAGPMEAMLSLCRGQVVGLHPLFGPTAKRGQGPLTIAACRGRGESGFRWIRAGLEDEGYDVREIHPAEHDRIMAVIQGVNHFSAMALGLFLKDCGIRPEDLHAWSTPTFRSTMSRIRDMAAQPGELFRGLLLENPASKEHIHQYIETVNMLNQTLFSQDAAKFELFFGGLKAVFGNGGHNG